MERGRLVVLLALVLLTVGAWALTIYQAQTMVMPMGVVPRDASVAPDPTTVNEDMGGMAMDDAADTSGMAMEEAAEMASAGMAGAGWSLAGLIAFVVAWAVMMAAMMFPAAAPMVLLFRTVATQRQTSGAAFVPTWMFVAGYLLVWTAVGAITWGGGAGAERSGRSTRRACADDLGAGCAGSRSHRGRSLPIDSAQAALPRSLPLTPGLRHVTLA
jgi:predicted metal-binding membrane protein